MPKTTVTTYGEGGHNPQKPNNNILESKEIELPDLPPTPEERLTHIEESIRQATSLADLKARVASGPKR